MLLLMLDRAGYRTIDFLCDRPGAFDGGGGREGARCRLYNTKTVYNM